MTRKELLLTLKSSILSFCDGKDFGVAGTYTLLADLHKDIDYTPEDEFNPFGVSLVLGLPEGNLTTALLDITLRRIYPDIKLRFRHGEREFSVIDDEPYIEMSATTNLVVYLSRPARVPLEDKRWLLGLRSIAVKDHSGAHLLYANRPISLSFSSDEKSYRSFFTFSFPWLSGSPHGS